MDVMRVGAAELSYLLAAGTRASLIMFQLCSSQSHCRATVPPIGSVAATLQRVQKTFLSFLFAVTRHQWVPVSHNHLSLLYILVGICATLKKKSREVKNVSVSMSVYMLLGR